MSSVLRQSAPAIGNDGAGIRRPYHKAAFCGAAAGIINGVFGAGGGMLLVPLLQRFGLAKDRELFASALCVMLPVSAVSFAVHLLKQSVDWKTALPCCIGGLVGGLLGSLLLPKLPLKWLHLGFGLLILYGAVRQLL